MVVVVALFNCFEKLILPKHFDNTPFFVLDNFFPEN